MVGKISRKELSAKINSELDGFKQSLSDHSTEISNIKINDNTANTNISNLQKEVGDARSTFSSLDARIDNDESRILTVENNKAEKTYVDTQLATKANQSTTYTKTEVDNRIQAVINAAPAALDTLKELADALGDDPNFATTMTNLLATKVDKITGKQLSTEDYTTAEKTKLAGIETNANKYIHPTTHPATMITQDTNNRFISDIQISHFQEAYDKRHVHDNESILDTILQDVVDRWNAAYTHTLDTIGHITASERTLWNTVSNKLDKSGGTMTGIITTPNNSIGIKFGDDASIGDGNISNNILLQGQQNPTLGGITFGSDKDTNIYRKGANILASDDTFTAANLQVNGVDIYYPGNKPTPADIGASPSTHLHDDRYYTETEINGINGHNMWLYRRWNNYGTGGVVPSFKDIPDLKPDIDNLIQDGANLIYETTEPKYIAYFQTNVYVSANKTFSVTFNHDEGCTVYVNDIAIFTSNTYTSSTMNISLLKGWNTIEIVYNQTSGGSGIYNLSPTISSQVEKLGCFYHSHKLKHKHSINDIPDFPSNVSDFNNDSNFATKDELTNGLNTKANTSHGNHVPTTETANNARFLRNDNTWQTILPDNINAMPRYKYWSMQDLNTIKTTGIHSITVADNTNAPTATNGTLIADFNVGTPYQIWIPDDKYEIWKRNYSNTSSAWSSWVNLISASAVGLGNVTNQSKSTMFSSPVFTGTPTAPTANQGTNSDQLATTKYVDIGLNTKANVSHGNHVPTTETADNARFLRNDNTWQTILPANIGAAVANHSHNSMNIYGTKPASDLPSSWAVGMYSTEIYNNGYPCTYGHLLTIKANRTSITQLAMEWKGTDATIGSMWIRNRRDTGTDAFSDWREFSFLDHSHVISDITNLQSSLDSKLNTSGGTLTGNLSFSDCGISFRGVTGIMAGNDCWRVGGSGTSSDWGYMEIATADNGNEPIYVRQYTGGQFNTLVRSMALLDENGNTSIPGNLNISNGIITAKSLVGPLTGNASSASKLSSARTISLTGDVVGSVSFDGSSNASISTSLKSGLTWNDLQGI